MKNKFQTPFLGHFISPLVNLNVSVGTSGAQLKNESNSFFGSYHGGQWMHNIKLRNKKKSKIHSAPYRSSCVSNLEKFFYTPVNSTKRGYTLLFPFRYGINSSDKVNKLKTKKYAVKKTETPSRLDILQNQGSPKDYSKLFLNCVFDKGRLKAFVLWFLQNYGQKRTIELLEQLKQIGFGYATKAGISLGIDDLRIPPQKGDLLINAQAVIHEGSVQYKRGEITGVEKFQRLIDTWHQTSENLKQEVIRHFEATDLLNPVYMMAFSGARGNISQVRQLVGMRGLMADPQGQIIDFPIRSNFREGLTLTEYIISSYGARKGIVDTALRTANAGYLTRRLVDVAQHVIVCEFDCKTNRGILVLDMKEGNKTIYSFQNRLLGRVLAKDIFNKQQKIASKNQEVSVELANSIAKITKKALIRSPLTCETKKLVCQLCYGWSLSTSSLVSIGEAVGIIAAQSIGEPGTQLTMRTFHTGGVFSGGLSEQIIAQNDGIIEYSAPIPGICVRTLQGQIAFLTKAEGCLIFKTTFRSSSAEQSSLNIETLGASSKIKMRSQKDSAHTKIWNIPPYTVLFARNKQKVFKKQIIAQLSSFSLSGEVQKTPRGDAEQTIYALFEGQIYNSNIDVIEKFNEYNDLTFEAWGWGYLWILAGKIYQYPIQSYIFAQPGDFIGKNSLLNRIEWISADKFFLNTNFVNSRELNLSKYSTSYAQNEFTLSHNPRTLEMEKSLNFFQPYGLMKKNMKLSIPTRYKKPETIKIKMHWLRQSQTQMSYSYSKNLLGAELNQINVKASKKIQLDTKWGNRRQSSFYKDLLFDFTSKIKCKKPNKNRFRAVKLKTSFQIASAKIHSNRLIRAKFLMKNFDVDYWKFINSLNDFVSYSKQYKQKIDLLNFDYPFHKFLRKRLSTTFKKRYYGPYKIRHRYLRKLRNTETLISLYENNPRKHKKANQMNLIHFLQLTENQNLDFSNKNIMRPIKSPFNPNFRIATKNQSDIFVYNQSTYLKKWKLLRFVYPYVNKKTIKPRIFSKCISFQKNRIFLHDVTNKWQYSFLRKTTKKHYASNIMIPLSIKDPSFTSNFKTMLKHRLSVQYKTHFKPFNSFQKKQSGLTRLLSSKMGEQHTSHKNSLILNESSFKRIVHHNRNHKKKSNFNVVAQNSKKVSSILLKKPVLSLSLKNLRYQKLGYHFSYNFRNAGVLLGASSKSTNSLKTPFFSSSEVGDRNKASHSSYLRKSPLNFGYYASNKNKDEFFNKFSLKTSIDSLDRLKDKQNTYEWGPMFDFFLQWFPSRHQTLNNGVFIFSGIHLTSPFLFKTKNSLVFSSNKKKNFRKTQTFRLNCYQFKRKSTKHSSTHKIHYTKNTNPTTKQMSLRGQCKLPILKNLRFGVTASCFFLPPQNTLSFEFSTHKNIIRRIEKRPVFVREFLMRNYPEKSKNEFDSLPNKKTILIKKQLEQRDNLTNNRNQISVISSKNKVFYSLHKAHNHFKNPNKQKNHSAFCSANPYKINIRNQFGFYRHENSYSLIYSLNTPHLHFFKKSENNTRRLIKSNFAYKSLHQMKVYDFKVHNSKTKTLETKLTQRISAIKNSLGASQNQLRWQNKKPKHYAPDSVSNKSSSRVTKKTITKQRDFRKKPKMFRSFDTKYNKKSTCVSFSPRSKFSVSWNEVFWIPQEDYQISVWPFSSNTAPNFVQDSLNDLRQKSYVPDKNKVKFHIKTKMARDTLISTIESTDFMNTRSKPLFYLNNRQGLKKPFCSKLEGFTKIFIKSNNPTAYETNFIESRLFSNNKKTAGSSNALNGAILRKKTDLCALSTKTTNESSKINTTNLMNLQAFMDFSRKIHYMQNPASYRFQSNNLKQNRIYHAPNSINHLYQNLKLSLINVVKTKWQMNFGHIYQNEGRFRFKKQHDSENDRKKHTKQNTFYRVMKQNSLYQKHQNQLSLFYYAQNKFVPESTLHLLNVPITSQVSPQKTLFSHFVFRNSQVPNKIIQNTLIEHNNKAIKKQSVLTDRSNENSSVVISDHVSFPSSATVPFGFSYKNQMNLNQKMRISIQPGWVYYSLNRSGITKCHQKIVDFGKFVVDDVLFTNHRVYVKNVVYSVHHNNFPDSVNILSQNSQSVQVNLDNHIAMKSLNKAHNPLDNTIRYSSPYSFHLNDCPPFGSVQSNNNEKSIMRLKNQNAFELSASCVYKVNIRISSSKSRYGNFILTHGANIAHTSGDVQSSDPKTLFDLPNIGQKQDAQKNSSHLDDCLAIFIRPMQHKILPNLHFYKTKIYRTNKKSLESNFSILAYKNFHSQFLNKQKCDQKFIPTFPGIDIKISSSLKHYAPSPHVKKIDTGRHMGNSFYKTNQKAESKTALGTSSFSLSKTHNAPYKKPVQNVPLLPEKASFKNSMDQTYSAYNKNILLSSKKTPHYASNTFNAFSNKHTKFIRGRINLFFQKTPVRHCFEQSYLTLSTVNFLPLNLEFSIPSSFHYLFKIPLFNFNSSAKMSFAEQQITKELCALSSPKFKSYILNNLVLKNQRRFALLKPHKSSLSNTDLIKTKSFLDSLASLSFLPRFDFWLSAKMSYLANQRLFASHFNSRDFSVPNKDALDVSCLLESFGNFPISENQVGSFQSNKVSSNEPFAMTSLKSPLRGEMLFKPSKNWSSEANQNRCLILTESDLFCFYLPNIDTEIKTTTASNRQKSGDCSDFPTKKRSVLENSSCVLGEQRIFKNKFSSLYQNFHYAQNQLEQIHFDKTIATNKQKVNEDKKNDNIIVQYNKKFYKIKGLQIGPVKSHQKLRLGSLLVYGDLISLCAKSASAIDRAGQIIHMNCSKVTFRRAQPISVSPKGILHAYNQDFVTQNAAVITLPFQTLKTGDIVQGIPKVEQYFEARTTKRGRLYRDSLPNLLQGLFERYRTLLPLEKAVRQSFLKIQQIIVDGVQRVYRSQGVSISDKHLEVIVRQMTSKVQIVHGGQTGFFPGELVDLEFVEHVNQFLLKKIYYEPVVLGITRASLEVESFLSAASFQQTTKVLSKAAVYRKKDFLKGLKENIIVGNLIPGGTGYLVHLKEFFNMRSK